MKPMPVFRHTLLALIIALLCPSALPAADQVPDTASVGGKYSELIQVLPCPRDKKTYGEFNDYGHWGGGAWCGGTGKAGYWVYVSPNWYVWALEGAAQEVPPMASAGGKYSRLLQVLNCPRDKTSYGEFNDYGHWGGGAWCGSTGKAGYWVYVAPNWYVWADKVR